MKRRFDGFMTTQRGEVLRELRSVLNLKDMDTKERKAAIERIFDKYFSPELGGKNQGLKTSLNNMNPLHKTRTANVLRMAKS